MTVAATPIRPMTAADTVPAAELLRANAFGERLDFFSWAVTQPTVRAFVAERNDEIVGTGVASVQGPVGWVGVIFVAPSVRRAGLGRRITRVVIEHLEAAGCRTQILIASPLGRSVYEREGFEVAERQVRFTIDGLPPSDDPGDPLVRSFAPGDLDAVVQLDRSVTGGDRGAILRELVTPESCLVALDRDGAVHGYLARAPFRGGGVIARDPDDAMRLLARRRYATGISGKAGAGLLFGNTVGRGRLRAAGWLEELGGVRMHRGAPLEWEPNAIWGQFSGALG